MHAQISGSGNTVSICLTRWNTTLNMRCLDYRKWIAKLFHTMDCNRMVLNTKTLNVSLEQC